jgi:hypothetical protein
VFKRVFGAVIYDFIRMSGKRASYTQVPPSTALALGLVVTYRNEGGLQNESKELKKKNEEEKEKSLLLLPP